MGRAWGRADATAYRPLGGVQGEASQHNRKQPYALRLRTS